MRSNESAFHWLTPVQGNAQQRDYPMRDGSIILAMTDLILYPPYMTDQSHIHNCMEIGVCLEGTGTIAMDGQPVRAFEAGTVIVVPKGAFHSQQNEHSQMVRWRYIAVDQSRLMEEAMPSCRQELKRLLENNRCGIFLSSEAMRSDIEWLIGRMFDIKCKTAEEATAELEAILLLIFMRICRNADTEDQLPEPEYQKNPVEPALLYISEQYHNEIKIAQLARSCAMSESYFRKVFQQNMGVSPVEYLNRYRVERAIHMIKAKKEMNVSQVAEACGFASIATFNRNFVRYSGQKPTDFKRQNTEIHASDE